MPVNFLALDVGQARIGLAIANDIVRIASPLPVLIHDEKWLDGLKTIANEQQVSRFIVGWPRGLNGQYTEQTEYVDHFITQLEAALPLPVIRQDEALTSVKAESELRSRGKPYDKGDIDSLSAVYILDDYLNDGVH